MSIFSSDALASGIHHTGKLLMESVTLTGEGALGLAVTPGLRAMTAALPTTAKLGRVRPAARPQCLRLEAFIDEPKLAQPADSVDWYTKAAESITRMYLNDRYGDCVIAGKAHALGVWSANDPDSADSIVLATDDEIYSQYQAVCGRGDNGCYIPAVLDYMRAQGLVARGKRYKIEGYVSADWRSKEITQIGLQLFGAGCIGINLPSAWTNDAIWDVTNTRIVGGHDVTPCGYGSRVLDTNADGVVVSSWGRLYLITWAAWTSTRWLEELYFMLPTFLWTGKDQMAPSGLKLDELRTALKQIGGGTVPPLPDPLIEWSSW